MGAEHVPMASDDLALGTPHEPYLSAASTLKMPRVQGYTIQRNQRSGSKPEANSP